MKKITLLATALLCSGIASAQNNNNALKPTHELSADLGMFYTPLLSQNLLGVNFEFKYYPTKRFATGLSASMATRKLPGSFQYDDKKPVINYSEIGWINQYDLVHSDKVRLSMNLNNGIAIARLGDNSHKEVQWTGKTYVAYAQEVATNYFYMVQPGIDASFRIHSNKHDPDIYLTTKAKYRYVFGDNKYGQISDFSNYYLSVGISLIGFDTEKPKVKS